MGKETEPVHKVDCPGCQGTGEVHSHNPKCWDCNGTGKVDPATAARIKEQDKKSPYAYNLYRPGDL